MKNQFANYFNKQTDASSLAVFRIGFGLLMLASTLRVWLKGWIKTLYVDPLFHFKYYGFEWVHSLGEWTYLLFFICALSSLCITLGFKYRISIVIFFISFSYIQLIDKTTYLNHYYFISILSFLLIFLPLNATFSVDNILKNVRYNLVPRWTLDSIKFLIVLVYFYAGIAKINYDWLISAQPLSIWLSSKYYLPIIGGFLDLPFIHYAFSWGGMIYDITIPFLLLYKRTRKIGFALVIIFHVLTAILFPSIGMFPYIMMFSSIIFLSSNSHVKILEALNKLIIIKDRNIINKEQKIISNNRYKLYIITLFFIIQLFLPLRHFLYSGNLLWTEQGYRFSWRVMLIEKRGHAVFKVINDENKDVITVENEEFLTKFQEKQMSFQADFILEYAHFIGDIYKARGIKNPIVLVDNYVTLNGRLSKRFVANDINLYKEKESFKSKEWIIPL